MGKYLRISSYIRKPFLKGRSQKVDINGHLSSEQELDISVIQGSTLGPILFYVI